MPLLLNLNSAFRFLQGPFLLAYVMALVGMRQRFAGFDFLHLLPFAGYVLFLAISQRSIREFPGRSDCRCQQTDALACGFSEIHVEIGWQISSNDVGHFRCGACTFYGCQ